MKRIILDLTDEEFELAWHASVRRGCYRKESPQKPWTEREKRECIRHFVVRELKNG